MLWLAGGLLALVLALPAHAEDGPPARVGEVSFAAGNAGWHAPGAAWSDAAVNQPVAAGAGLRTDPQGKAELRLGPLTIRLAEGTTVEIGRLDAEAAQIALPHGRIALELAQLGDGQSVEIDLPRGGVWLLQPGEYDIDAGTAEVASRVAALAGDARFIGKGADLELKPGQAALLSGSGAIAGTVEPAPAADAFVEWCRSRAVDETRLAALYHISREVSGYQELDAHGDWAVAPEYGAIWYPRDLPADWVPYRYGHWAWIAPWGWSWIDDRSWGFATAHYGRWARIGERWGWVPGAVVPHPVYAPALVAFIGTPGIGLSVPDGAGPAIGWFPLAPGEVYWPGYTRDIDAIRQLNAGAVADLETIREAPYGGPPGEIVNGRFANREFATVIPRAVFAAAKPVAPALLSLPEQRIAQAPVIMGSPQLPPPGPHRIVALATIWPRAGLRPSSPFAGAQLRRWAFAPSRHFAHFPTPHPSFGHGRAVAARPHPPLPPPLAARLHAPAYPPPARSSHFGAGGRAHMAAARGPAR
ncbi:MAG: hypothetical protein JO038_06500 [Alphaproteobacteria bacterium]|nr:hypothetical protein [Alphaproteobacteria bacterium]